jgi:hypothetical protein
MGLDMYLEAKISFYTEYDKNGKRTDLPKAKRIRHIFPEMFKTGNLNYIKVSFEAGYWRKANHIHKWFVENIQDGNDDCGDYDVPREDLKRLLAICREVLSSSITKKGKVYAGTKIENGKEEILYEDGKLIKNPEVADSLLPTRSGLFFGSPDYDEYYLEDVRKTIKIIERCLKLPDEWDFKYHSSW